MTRDEMIQYNKRLHTLSTVYLTNILEVPNTLPKSPSISSDVRGPREDATAGSFTGPLLSSFEALGYGEQTH